MNKLKPKVNYIPYKSLVINTCINPLTSIIEPLTITLSYQLVTLGKWCKMGDQVFVQIKYNNQVIQKDLWSEELKNLSKTLTELYPTPGHKEEIPFKISNKTKKILLAVLVFFLIIFLLYKKLST